MLRGIVMDQACYATTRVEPACAAERITHERPTGREQLGPERPRELHRHLRKCLAIDRTAKIRHRFTNEAADSFHPQARRETRRTTRRRSRSQPAMTVGPSPRHDPSPWRYAPWVGELPGGGRLPR